MFIVNLYANNFETYKNSCDDGDATGCAYVGLAYSKQDNNIQAVKFLGKACEGGHMDACTLLGAQYESGGNGVERDYAKAIEIYSKASNAGNIGGHYFLGLMFEKGNGVKQNHIKAKELYKKSCSGGYGTACEAYKRLSNNANTTNKLDFLKKNMNGLSYCSATYFVRSATPDVIKDQSKVYSSYGQMTSFIAGVYYKKVFNRVATNGDTGKLREKYFESLEKEYRKNKTLLPQTLEKIAQCDSLLLYMYNNPQLSTALKNAKRGTLEDESLLLDALAVTTKKPVETNKEYILESFKIWIEDHNAMTPAKMKKQLMESLKNKSKK